MVRSTSTPFSPCISFRALNCASVCPVTGGTLKQTVIGAVYEAVVVTSKAILAPSIANPPGKLPAELGFMGITDVVPAVPTFEKLRLTGPSSTVAPAPAGVVTLIGANCQSNARLFELP